MEKSKTQKTGSDQTKRKPSKKVRPESKSQIVHFSVSGDYLTELSRALMLEGNWEKALRILKSGLDEISTDQVIMILSGTFKLIGVNDICMAKDDDEEYPKELNRTYSGYIRAYSPGHAESWYRAYSQITDFGPRDAPDPDDEVEQDEENNAFVSNTRAMHYAKDKSDITARLNIPGEDPTYVLFAMVSSPPFWMVDDILKRNKTPQSALDDYLTNDRRLTSRGHTDSYGEIGDETSEFFRPKNIEPNLARWEQETENSAPDYSQLIMSIKEQAGSNWYEFKAGERTIKVPRAPFEHWCLSRTSGVHLAMEWKIISPVGLKMVNDDPYHTDWMLGADLPIDSMNYGKDQELVDGAYAARHKIQEEKLDFKCAVLSGRGQTDFIPSIHAKEGDNVSTDAIVVLPNCNPKYFPLISQIKTGAIIVEQGGSMAHLVNIAREMDCRIVLIPNARKLYPNGIPLMVDCDSGTVSIRTFIDHEVYNPWDYINKNKKVE